MLTLNDISQVDATSRNQTMDVHLGSARLPALRALIPGVHQRADSPDLMAGAADSLSFWQRLTTAHHQDGSWPEMSLRRHEDSASLSISRYAYLDDSSDLSSCDQRIATPSSVGGAWADEIEMRGPTPPRASMLRRASAPAILCIQQRQDLQAVQALIDPCGPQWV